MADLTSRVAVVISASTAGAVRELDTLHRQASKTDAAFDTLGKKAGLAGATIKAGLVAGAGALLGTGLVSFLNDSVTAFADSQRAAQLFSTAMNTSGENAGKLSTYLNTLGIDTNDLIEINAEFGKALGQNRGALDDLGVSLKKNADGSIDTADAFVQVIDGLQGVKDGAERSQLALKFFGEEGTKQLAPLIFGSKNLKATLEDLEFVYDPKRAQEYAAAQQDLNLAFTTLQQTIGQALIPAFTDATRAATDVINFLGDIPDQAYLVVGATAALAFALKSTLVQGAFGAVLTVGTQIGATFTALQTGLITTGTVAGGAAAAVKTAMAGIVASLGPLALIAAGVYAVTEAFQSWNSTKSAAVNIDRTTGSLREQAEALNKTDSVWRTFVVGNDVEKSMRSITKALKDQAVATLDSADATQLEKDRAQELLDVLGDGTLAQQTANLATEEGRAAQDAYARSLGASAIESEKAARAQEELADVITEYVLAGGDMADANERIAAAAETAAAKQAQQEEITRLQAEALAIASGNLGFFIEKLRALESFDGSGMEALKDQLLGISLVDNPDTSWVDEYKIGAEQAGDAILNELIAALETEPDLDPAAWFASLREGAPPEIAAIINEIERQFNEDGGVKAIVKAELDAAQAKKDLDAAAQPRTVPLTATPGNIGGAKAVLDGIVLPRTAPLTATPENTGGAKAALDGIVLPRTAPLTATPENTGGAKAALDGVVLPRTAPLVATPQNVGPTASALDALKSQRFAPIVANLTGQSAYLSALAALTAPRTQTIRVNYNGIINPQRLVPGQNPVPQSLEPQRSIPNLYANVQPTNIFKVAIDGQPLRAWIRSEVAAAQPVRAGVA